MIFFAYELDFGSEAAAERWDRCGNTGLFCGTVFVFLIENKKKDL
jgi:hypothetical protein